MTKRRTPNAQIHAVFHVDRDRPRSLEGDLAGLFHLREHLRTRAPKMSSWYLGGNTKEEALLYEAFDEGGFTPGALAVLKERDRLKAHPGITHGAGLWNGEESPDGASMVLSASLVGSPSFLLFSTDSAALLSHDNMLATTLKIVELWQPDRVSVAPALYDAVFKKRPGAGWMLYLPRPITVQQVPEARLLVPVVSTDAKGKPQQRGTVIVSIDDGPFSEQNPEHVKRAHDIEIRLAGQDLLPHFGDPPSPPR